MEMQHPGVKVNTSNLVSYRVQGPCNPTSASRTQPFRGTEQSISFPTTIYKKRKLQDKLGCRKGNTIIKNIKKHEGPEFSNVQLTYTRFSWVNTCQDNHMAASCLSSAKLSFNNPNLNDNREKKKKKGRSTKKYKVQRDYFFYPLVSKELRLPSPYYFYPRTVSHLLL